LGNVRAKLHNYIIGNLSHNNNISIFRLEKQRREYEAFVPKRGPKKGKVCPKLPIYRFNANCELKVNEKNSWWHQIQGQLHITGLFFSIPKYVLLSNVLFRDFN